MNAKLLIDLIVQQTTVLIAELATSAGLRAPLAHVAREVFVSLVHELGTQGVRQKVIADMFGMALRTYQKKVRRLEAERGGRGRSLWQAVIEFLKGREVTSRAELHQRFRREDEATLRGIVGDLVESGLVFRTGSGDHEAYRAATPAELDQLTSGRPETTAAILWVLIHEHGPITRAELAKVTSSASDDLTAPLGALLADGRVAKHPGPDGELLSAASYRIGFEEPSGWEAALFDHYQAVVQTFARKLRQSRTARMEDTTGGSTYRIDLWEGHPALPLVTSLLQRARGMAAEARDQAAAVERPDGARPVVVTFYAGQTTSKPGGFEEEEG